GGGSCGVVRCAYAAGYCICDLVSKDQRHRQGDHHTCALGVIRNREDIRVAGGTKGDSPRDIVEMEVRYRTSSVIGVDVIDLTSGTFGSLHRIGGGDNPDTGS